MPQCFLAADGVPGCRGVAGREGGIEADQRPGRRRREGRGSREGGEPSRQVGCEHVGDVSLAGVGTDVDGAGARRPKAGVNVLEQACLPEPGAGGDAHMASAAPARVFPRRENLPELPLTAHQLGHQGSPPCRFRVLQGRPAH